MPPYCNIFLLEQESLFVFSKIAKSENFKDRTVSFLSKKSWKLIDERRLVFSRETLGLIDGEQTKDIGLPLECSPLFTKYSMVSLLFMPFITKRF